MSPTRSPAQLAEFLSTVERELSTLRSSDAVLRGVTRLAVEQVDGAEYAGITRGFQGRFTSVAPTDALVEHVDGIQYRLTSGPCVDAVINSHVYCADDLRTDSRWPEFGRQAFQATGVLSMLSFRLYLENDDGMMAALNLYSTQPAAFDQTSEITGEVLATAGAMTIAAAHAKEKVNNLEIALRTSREIGIAIGVLHGHPQTRPRASL